MTTFSPSFRRTLDMITNQQLHLVPLLENAIRECDFPEEFSVTFRNYKADRPPDGWFHPSTHPTMGERELYYYLTQPEKWVRPPFEYGSRMAVMVGTAMHDLVAAALLKLGVLIEPTGTCVACQRPHGHSDGECSEWGVVDHKLGRRGHLDGRLQLDGWGSGRGIYDLKTATPMALRGIQSNDLDAFRKKWPYYYGQQQEYLALDESHGEQSLVLFLGMSQGWEMREFTIPRDEQYIAALEAKYRAVRNYQEAGTIPPIACCSGGATARKCAATACLIRQGAMK